MFFFFFFLFFLFSRLFVTVAANSSTRYRERDILAGWIYNSRRKKYDTRTISPNGELKIKFQFRGTRISRSVAISFVFAFQLASLSGVYRMKCTLIVEKQGVKIGHDRTKFRFCLTIEGNSKDSHLYVDCRFLVDCWIYNVNINW